MKMFVVDAMYRVKLRLWALESILDFEEKLKCKLALFFQTFQLFLQKIEKIFESLLQFAERHSLFRLYEKDAPTGDNSVLNAKLRG